MGTHRRVVTGHDTEGRSVIVTDGPSTNRMTLDQAGGLILSEMWETMSAPASNAGFVDTALRPRSIVPRRAGGTVFRIIDYPPDSVRYRSIAAPGHYADMGAQGDASGRHPPGMHRTDTIDYAIVLKGEIWAVMEAGETLLRAGDCLVQRGTNHAWSNRTEEVCTIAFVLVSALPLE